MGSARRMLQAIEEYFTGAVRVTRPSLSPIRLALSALGV